MNKKKILFWIVDKTLKSILLSIILFYIVLAFYIFDIFRIGELILVIFDLYLSVLLFFVGITVVTSAKYNKELHEYFKGKREGVRAE